VGIIENGSATVHRCNRYAQGRGRIDDFCSRVGLRVSTENLLQLNLFALTNPPIRQFLSANQIRPFDQSEKVVELAPSVRRKADPSVGGGLDRWKFKLEAASRNSDLRLPSEVMGDFQVYVRRQSHCFEPRRVDVLANACYLCPSDGRQGTHCSENPCHEFRNSARRVIGHARCQPSSQTGAALGLNREFRSRSILVWAPSAKRGE
jgi:hypothetical protein